MEKILFNEYWLFHKGDVEYPEPLDKGSVYMGAKTETKLYGPASRNYVCRTSNFGRVGFCADYWEAISLPHDYVILQEPSEEYNRGLGYFKYENAWYRKEFNLNENDKNKRLTLVFDGVATHCEVYMNGCIVKRNFCGYNTFEVDITDFIKFGDEKNILAVYVTTDSHEGWWYEGGGIYRNVWLVKNEKVSVDLWGLYVNPQKISDTTWKVKVETTVRNDNYNDVTALCKTTLYDNEKNAVASCEATTDVELRESAVAFAEVSVENPKIWDIDSPNLYIAVTEVYVDGQKTDEYSTRFGFRTFGFDKDKGFILNGRYVKIKGVCAHQDVGLTGKAVADNVQRYRAKLIKEMGANAFRCSHYPHPESFMDALDELGIVVMDETRWFSSEEESMKQLEMVVKRDRNRPSVIFWSVGNEEPHHITEEGRRICKSMMAKVRKLDNSRVVMTAVSNSPDQATVYDELDAIGVNYNWDKYDYIHEKYPDKPIFSSECCATGTTRGWYDDDSHERGYICGYDHDVNEFFRSREFTWKFICERDWLLGGFQWDAFEHRGETEWPRLCSQSGAIDLYLQKKDAFYQNMSHWTDEPMVHLLPHWNFEGREGENIKVSAYTNCDELELFLNDKSLGKQQIEKYGHGEWVVPFEKGTVLVKGYKNGVVVCSDSRTTSDKAVKLNLVLDNEVSANGRDVAIITCYCTDENGIEVPTSSPIVSFNCNKLGTIIATGSDISDHTPVTSPVRKMRAGRITVAVKTAREKGTLKVFATADGLADGVLNIEIK